MAWNSGFRKVESETDSAILANALVGFKALFVERGSLF
jgi:hypothetical protein